MTGRLMLNVLFKSMEVERERDEGSDMGSLPWSRPVPQA